MTAFNPEVNENPSLNPCSVTLVKSDLPMRKVFNGVGEAKPIKLPKTVSASYYPVMDLTALHDLLVKLADQPHLCIIRGGFHGQHLDGGKYTAKDIRRKSKGADAPMFAVARSWVCLDVDGVTVPDEVWTHEDDTKTEGLDLGDAANPRELRCRNWLLNNVLGFMGGATCIVQWSSSCFLPSKGQTISAHIWYWLSEPLTDLQIRFWLAQEKAAGKTEHQHIDASLARAVQPHFTANPDLSKYHDPIKGVRTVLCPGDTDEFDVCDVLDAWDEYGETMEATKAARAEKAAAKAAAGGSDNDQKKVIEALEFVSPDCDYETWVMVGMAIHSAWPSDEGLAIWDSWSANGSEYVPGETEAKWESFSPEGGVGLGSIFHVAVENGFDHHSTPDLGPDPDDYSVMTTNDAPAAPAAPAKKMKKRVEITWYKSDLNGSVNIVLGAIKDHYNDNPSFKAVYVKDGALVRYQKDQKGDVSFPTLNPVALRGLLCKRIRWMNEVVDKEGVSTSIPCDISKDVCETLLAVNAHHPSIPVLLDVKRHATFGSDGVMRDKSGYYPATRTFVIPPAGRNITFPEAPTKADVDAALTLIFDEWLCDFPFSDLASRANTLALALAPLVRPLIEGNMPLHLITAPRPRTGKTKLAQCIALAHSGKVATEARTGKDENDWKAQITSALSQDPSMVLIDNLPVNKSIDSPTFASMLTSRRWSERIYGSNTNRVDLPNDAAWVATGNNPSFSGELTGRVLLIELDPKCPDPSARTGFKHENIEKWTIENADLIVSALATLVQKWLSEGKPAPADPVRLGGFEDYMEVIGGIFGSCDMPCLHGNKTKLHAAMNSEESENGAFIHWWWSERGMGKAYPMTPKQMLDEWDQTGAAYLETQLGATQGNGRAIRLGNLLKRWSGEGGLGQVRFSLGEDVFVICKGTRSSQGVRYYVKHESGPNEGYGHDAPDNPFDSIIKNNPDLDDAMECLF